MTSASRTRGFNAQVSDTLGKLLPEPIYARINSQLGHYLGVFIVSAGLVGADARR